MYYTLFSEGQAILGNPFLIGCTASLIPLLVVGFAWSLGADIRRQEDTQQSSMLPRLMLHLLVTLLLSVAYIGIASHVAIARGRGADLTGFMEMVVGQPPIFIYQSRILMFAFGHWGVLFLANLMLHQNLTSGGWLRGWIDQMRNPPVQRGELGSSHFCTHREYKRYRVPDSEGMTFFGAFWGDGKQRLDAGQGMFCLNDEDAARGILTLGGPGSGKTQGVILPAIADNMANSHSLIVADPQGELKYHIMQYARVTGHLVVIHDPTGADAPRFNLAENIQTVSDARAIADVLVPSAQGDNKFWSDSAAALLAACLIRYANLGDIYESLKDLKTMAADFGKQVDDAALLANSFIASVNSDGKVASNVVATLATALTGWASVDVRHNTATSDFDADLIVQQPTVVVLTCPGRMRAVYASYLGAVLRKLMLDLDTIGEAAGGQLPVPVNIILDEFPTLGKLDGLVADVNLVRKRRISILIAAQTKGQFHLIYGQDGTQALFTGLATQIVYGGCDAETAEFYSRASGTATQQDETTYRSRPLLTVDEVVTPQAGNTTIFARYVDPGYATQIILTGRLTRFYERKDWAARIKAADEREPILLERGLSIRLSDKPQLPPQAVTIPLNLESHFDAIFEKTQAMPAQARQQAGDDLLAVVAPHHAAFNASLSDLRR
ncbi:MAG: type IV secretory system conjugative DNA transfer family protein [Anaerolineae bacterium]|nr:MAG: type IV secretory system conjugative DNA transfer family protein [Anaerolineae bacterium]